MFEDLTDEQLVHKVLQSERELVAARFKLSMQQLENTSRLRVIRKDIARMRTEARKREMAAGLARDALLGQHRRSFTAEQRAEGTAAAAPAKAEKGGFLAGIVDKLKGKETP